MCWLHLDIDETKGLTQSPVTQREPAAVRTCVQFQPRWADRKIRALTNVLVWELSLWSVFITTMAHKPESAVWIVHHLRRAPLTTLDSQQWGGKEREREERGGGGRERSSARYSRIRRENKGWKASSAMFFSPPFTFSPFIFLCWRVFSCGWRVSWEGGVSPTHSPPWCVISTYCQYAAIDFGRDWQTSNNGVSIWTKSFGDASAAAAIILLIRLIEWLCNRIHAGPRSRAQMRGRHGSASWKADMSVRWSNAFDHRTEKLFTIAFGWRTAKRSSIPSYHVALLSSFFLLRHHLFYLFSYFNKHPCGIEEERSLTWLQLLLAFLKT